jgi:hypothetical protein
MIVINTLGRPNKQPTLEQLLNANLEVTLVLQEHDAESYSHWYVPKLILPSDIRTLPKTRQWMLDNIQAKKLIIIDDDFTFFIREEGTVKLRHTTPVETAEMINQIYNDLDDYAAVGISMRQGNNRIEEEYKENSAINGFIGLRTDIVRQHDIRFDINPAMEDKHVILGLLTNGHKNKVWFKWCYNQPASNTGGGCSTYRTAEVQKQAAELLHQHYPNFVTVKVKTTKTGWFGGDRHDVVCYWKKAYEYGLSKNRIEFEKGTNLL